MANVAWAKMNRPALEAVVSGRITHADLTVLFALSLRASSKPPRECWPSLEVISKDSGLNRRSVIRSIERLQAAGLIKVHARKSSRGLPNSNLYVICDDSNLSDSTIQSSDHTVTSMVAAQSLGSDPTVTLTRSIELDPVGTRAVVCIDLVSKKEQIANLGEVAAADLEKAAKLVELHARAVELGLARAGQRDLQDFFGAAVYARRAGDDPARLLCGLIRNGAFLEPVVNVGSEDDADDGRRMLAAWRRSQAEPHNFARTLAADLFLMPGAREAKQ